MRDPSSKANGQGFRDSCPLSFVFEPAYTGLVLRVVGSKVNVLLSRKARSPREIIVWTRVARSMLAVVSLLFRMASSQLADCGKRLVHGTAHSAYGRGLRSLFTFYERQGVFHARQVVTSFQHLHVIGICIQELGAQPSRFVEFRESPCGKDSVDSGLSSHLSALSFEAIRASNRAVESVGLFSRIHSITVP